MQKRLLLLVVASVASGQTSRTPIDNEKVKVLSVDVASHVKTKLHEHKVNRVMIYLQPGKQDIVYQDGKTTKLTWKSGEPKWSPASGMHVAEMTTDSPVTIIEIELKQTGKQGVSLTDKIDPVATDRKHYHVEFENDQVRVVRVRIGVGDQVAMHRHSADRVVTYLTDQDIEAVTESGKTERVQHKAGDVSWGGAVTHREKNVSSAPFEAVITELKY